MEPDENRAIIKVKNADLAMAKLLEVFTPSTPVFEIDIHPTAVIHETANIGVGCNIGANCYVGKDVVLGDGVVLYPTLDLTTDATYLGNLALENAELCAVICLPKTDQLEII